MSTSARRADFSIAELRDVLEGPLPEIAQRFSAYISEHLPHRALVIFTRECTGRPRKVAGDPQIVDRVTIAELDRLRTELSVGAVRKGEVRVAGRAREAYAVLDRTDTVLLIIPHRTRPGSVVLEAIRDAFAVVATAIRLQVHSASPAYLAESRAASTERARTVAELTDAHAVTLETILATLRSDDLDDTRARITARETATAALIGLRSAVDAHREFAQEAMPTAFARLHGELRELLHHRRIHLQMVEPPVGGRGLPGEVAHGARAITRGAVLALTGQSDVARIRVAWMREGADLVLDVRDDGPGDLDPTDLDRHLADRVDTLGGVIETESTPGWGSRVSVRLPLDLPAVPADGAAADALAALGAREIEVLEHLVAGRRNRVIAERLGVSESTVKFHVAGILRKLGVGTRGEAAALGAEAGVRAAS